MTDHEQHEAQTANGTDATASRTGTPQQEHWPGIIPYVEWYTGARRLLTLDTMPRGAGTPPVVSIDGRQYFTFWGRLTFEIPAERAVHLSVHIEGDRVLGARSALIPPGGHVHYAYELQTFGANGVLTYVPPPTG
ncbi:hypothetical protein GCM10011490_17120 [Pseudoclavibacter endophyticus]|uniref:Uncharacterized protein n=1 Tax=Pseudoclavibacter endophyticus TaxID=1778590 RepID=A0A6H9WD98_9MICO|nr:hypothetical protein [Pseudoclavibacter endophyticus]KAB1648932.1 hypothetical protein F8O04_01105 [Pseudoclavibacter endophyticus]GGA67120.1 hypothetical protein GCM10011490_17120 [Pseudoclavibacter endophyticus]